MRKAGYASMGGSGAFIEVGGASGAGGTRAIEVIGEAAAAVAEGPAWSGIVLEPPEVWGVHAVDAAGVTIRLVVKTAPKQQLPLGRALRARIVDRLRHEGIGGKGQVLPIVQVISPGETPAAPTAG